MGVLLCKLKSVRAAAHSGNSEMMWLFFAFSGPVLWAVSTHLDKYLVERYFKDSSVAALLVFTALIGILALPFIGFWNPQVAAMPLHAVALISFSGVLYLAAM